jgi:hypothetical protein
MQQLEYPLLLFLDGFGALLYLACQMVEAGRQLVIVVHHFRESRDGDGHIMDDLKVVLHVGDGVEGFGIGHWACDCVPGE